ncbi:hypothetical protein E1B28_002176 [Marasmius oreades]|uniref:Uncharacterized protein n=1 Tax=Marasmius oreades TaxID=181124 RepID=A0A9P7RN36_9AGAR|nr:uncharacterized protein E1B28_002176 [Marasmius oreades]KAG7086211.1 hypothetical protein E1B28_002176 [Marasmius oreades]
MGSPDCTGERRKSVRQVRVTKKKAGSGGTIEEENAVHGAGNDSQIVKQEELPQQITPKPSYGWQNPAELNYFTPRDWNDTKIIHHLIAYAFDVPPKSPKNGQPFCQIVSMDGTKTVLPHGYRIPLMFLARFQWLSLKLVLSAANRQLEWEEYKFGILHVSRLCKQLLDSAQAALGAIDSDSKTGTKAKPKGVDRKWRCPTFDRALVRYRLKWFISKPAQVKEFWAEYGEDEYDKDVVGMGWRGWALKGHKGFSLTEGEIQNGISAQQLMQGLKDRNGQWYWETEGTPTVEGNDAWTLRHKALAAIPSFGTPPNPPPVSCLPLISRNSSNVAAFPPSNPPFRPPSTATISPKSVTYQPQQPPQSPSVSSPNSKSKSKAAQQDILQIMQAAGVGLPPGTFPKSDVKSSGTSIPVTAQLVSAGHGDPRNTPVRNRLVGDKRPGSPLEKEGPAKRALRPLLARVDSSSTVVCSEPSDPEPPPFTPTVSFRPIKREPSLDPDVEILHSAPSRFKRRTSGWNLQTSAALEDGNQSGMPMSPSSNAFANITKGEAARLMRANERELQPMVQELNLQRSGQSVVSDDSVAVDSKSPTEKPPSLPSPSGNRPQAPPNAVLLPPRPSVAIPSFSRVPSATSRPMGPAINCAKASPNGNHSQQVPSPSPAQPSPPIAPNAKTLDYIRSLHTQWQEQHHGKGNSDSAMQVSGVNGVAAAADTSSSTSGPSSNQRGVVVASTPQNQGGNLPLMMEDVVKKITAEMNDMMEVVRKDIRNVISDVIRGEMEKIKGDIGDVKREVQNGFTGMERGIRSSIASHLDGIVRSATKEEVSRVFGDAGTIKDLLAKAASRSTDGAVDEFRKELAKSREREQQRDAVLQEMRSELESIREAVSSGNHSRETVTPVTVPRPAAPAETSSLLFGHPLAHLCVEKIETDEVENSSDMIPGLSYTDQGSSSLQGQPRNADPASPPPPPPPSGSSRSYSGTPMSMSPDIVLLELEPTEQKYTIPDPEPIESPVVSPPRRASPNLYEDIIDVKPIIIDGEAFLPNNAGEPTPLTAFPSPIPARSHRKFRKMGMMGGGE